METDRRFVVGSAFGVMAARARRCDGRRRSTPERARASALVILAAKTGPLTASAATHP